MDILAFVFIFIVLQLICTVVGGRSSKGMKSQEDYFLAGKKVGFFPLSMTFLATIVGGGMVLGSAEEAYQYGWIVLFYPLGGVLGLLCLGLGIGGKMSQMGVTTVAQIFESVYGSIFLKKSASCLSMISQFIVVVAQMIASKKFMISLSVESEWLFIGFWGLVTLYTSLGGLKAVIATDVVQAAFFTVVFAAAFAFAASSFQIPNLELKEAVFPESKIYGWLFMPLLFMMIEQSMGQRCFAADSPRTVMQATLFAAFCTLLISAIPVFFGVLAYEMGLKTSPGASILMSVVSQTTTPLVAALVGCGVLTAIISTADSLINAIGSNLAQDFNRKYSIRSSQILSAAISASALLVSYFFTNVVDALIFSYELSVSCMFIPVVIALFKKQGSFLSAGLSMAFGAGAFVCFQFYPIELLPKEILSVGLSFFGFCLGEALAWRQVSYEQTS